MNISSQDKLIGTLNKVSPSPTINGKQEWENAFKTLIENKPTTLTQTKSVVGKSLIQFDFTIPEGCYTKDFGIIITKDVKFDPEVCSTPASLYMPVLNTKPPQQGLAYTWGETKKIYDHLIENSESIAFYAGEETSPANWSTMNQLPSMSSANPEYNGWRRGIQTTFFGPSYWGYNPFRTDYYDILTNNNNSENLKGKWFNGAENYWGITKKPSSLSFIAAWSTNRPKNTNYSFEGFDPSKTEEENRIDGVLFSPEFPLYPANAVLEGEITAYVTYEKIN